jgi:hypothetical protein
MLPPSVRVSARRDTAGGDNGTALFVLTLEGEQVSAITWFGDSSVFPHFGLPRTLRV